MTIRSPRRRDFRVFGIEAERFGGFEVYKEFNLGRLQYRQIGWFFALENPTGVDTGLPPSMRKARCIAHKTTDCHGRAPGVNRWHGMSGRQRDNFIGIGKKRNSAAHHERVNPLLNNVREGPLDSLGRLAFTDRRRTA